MTYNKRDAEIIAKVWDKNCEKSMKCPHCGKCMSIEKIEPINDFDNAYVPFDTTIECEKCNFKIRAESFTFLGGVKNYDLKKVEIGSWSPSGRRVVSNYEHLMNYDILKELRDSGKLVEFLVINKQIVNIFE